MASMLKLTVGRFDDIETRVINGKETKVLVRTKSSRAKGKDSGNYQGIEGYQSTRDKDNRENASRRGSKPEVPDEYMDPRARGDYQNNKGIESSRKIRVPLSRFSGLLDQTDGFGDEVIDRGNPEDGRKNKEKKYRHESGAPSPKSPIDSPRKFRRERIHRENPDDDRTNKRNEPKREFRPSRPEFDVMDQEHESKTEVVDQGNPEDGQNIEHMKSKRGFRPLRPTPPEIAAGSLDQGHESNDEIADQGNPNVI